jgi:dimethylglycine dehydrogenase
LTVDKCVELYNHEYDAGTPYEYEMRPAARGLKTTPATPRHEATGGVMFARFGWERPAWFAPPDEQRSEAHSFRHSNWFEPVRQECLAVRDRVGLLDLSPFSKWEVRGTGALDYLDCIGANRVPRKIGGVALTHALNTNGGVCSEFTVTRLGDDHFYVVSAAAAELHDDDLLRATWASNGSVQIDRCTAQWGTFLLSGPRARDVLAALCNADLSSAAFPWLSAREIQVAGIPVRALRVSFVGELGWELHHPIAQQAALYDALMHAGEQHGITPFGLRAMDCLRIEKMYRNWRSDLNTEFTLLEAGMQRFCKLDDDRKFKGKTALVAQAQAGLPHTLVALKVQSSGAHCLGSEPVLMGEQIIGITTSGAHGMRNDLSLALAYVKTAHAVEGKILAVDLLGQRLQAVVTLDAVYDAANARLRA